MSIEVKTKHCVSCDTIKPVSEYYMSRKWLQKRCKPCHNAIRKTYIQTSTYVKKKTGFCKLPDNVRIDILEDFKNIDSMAIYKKYGTENKFSYTTLRKWVKTGQLRT